MRGRDEQWCANVPYTWYCPMFRHVCEYGAQNTLNILHCYAYKITHVQELLPADPLRREAFALEFLARMEEHNEWPWSILWTGEFYFYLHGLDNTQNCSMWTQEKPFVTASVPIHSPKVTVWCGFTASCVVGTFVFGGDWSCYLYRE